MSSINKLRTNILYNRYVLYFFFAISLIDLYYLSEIKDYTSVTIFILVGLLVSFFNKNMIVILMIALAFTHLLKYGIRNTLNEGMETKEESESESEVKEDFEVEEPHVTEDSESGSVKEDFEVEEPEHTKESHEEFQAETNDDEVQKQIDKLNERHTVIKGMNKDMEEFEGLQKKILGGLNEISPMIDRVEHFIEKYEHYGKQK